MAKRSRGGTRPGQLRPAARRGTVQRPAHPASGPGPAPATTLSDAEEARAAELEAQIVAQERAAEAARRRPRGRARGEVAVGGRGEGSILAVRSVEEYAYVQRDLRRIIKVTGGLTGVIAVLWVLIDLTHIVRI